MDQARRRRLPAPPPRRRGWSSAPDASSSSPPAPARRARASDWILLDRFVHRSWRNDGDGYRDGTTSAASKDCVGRPFRVSLRVAEPPEVSRLYLHWPGRPEYPGMREPEVIAAHGHAILFEVTVPFNDPMTRNDTYRFPFDFFVYSAASSPPSLIRLPPCFIGGHITPHEDVLFRPYQRSQQRVMLEEQMGLLCHAGDGGEFTVADLTDCGHPDPDAGLCLLHHRPGSAEETQWRVKKMRFPSSLKGMRLGAWKTDAVVPLQGRYLCWFDCYLGALLVDILLANDEIDSNTHQEFRFITLPRDAPQSSRIYDEDSHDPARSVSVTDDGMIKLVCITKYGRRWNKRSVFTVTSWTLVDIHQVIWRRDFTMEHTEFFGLYSADQRLPRVPPSFPMVSSVDRDVICFLLEEDFDNIWIIEVNMRTRVLRSCGLYIKVEEEEETLWPSDIYRRNVFDGQSFFPTQFTSYLSKDAIKRSGTKQKDAGGNAAEEDAAKEGYIGVGIFEGLFHYVADEMRWFYKKLHLSLRFYPVPYNNVIPDKLVSNSFSS
ncbi:hypothetical protein ACP4OV_002122 [Aristida adscensionis]